MPDLTTAQLGAIQRELTELDKIYTNDTRGDSFRLFLLGDSGSGKTYTARTAPKPVHIDSFDPGGTQTLDDLIEKQVIFADTRFEQDDPTNPMAFKTWEAALDRRIRMGYFQAINTYYLDSLTTLSNAALALVQKEKGRPGTTPQQDDWLPQMTKLENALRKVAALPCNVVVTGHLELIKDELLGKVVYKPLLTGKLKLRLPLLFSEVYIMQTVDTPKGQRYAFLTQSTGQLNAKTRLGKGGLFERLEEPNIAALLKKAGKSWEDKEILSIIGGEKE